MKHISRRHLKSVTAVGVALLFLSAAHTISADPTEAKRPRIELPQTAKTPPARAEDGATANHTDPGKSPVTAVSAPADGDQAFQQAREAYLKRITEIERSAQRSVEEAIREARKRASEDRARELEAVRVEFVTALNAAIARAIENGNLDRASRLTKERESLAGQQIPAPAIDPMQFVDNRIYKCVLGIYGQFGRRNKFPVVNLAVPSRNLWSEDIQAKLRGRIDFTEINYQGTAKIIIRRDGAYRVELPARGTQFVLNGNQLSAGNVQLKMGVYDIRIATGTHGQPFLPESFVRIFGQETGGEIALVNSGIDVRQFLSSEIDNQSVTEVSGYRPEMVE